MRDTSYTYSRKFDPKLVTVQDLFTFQSKLLSLARLSNGISHEIFQESSKLPRSTTERNGRGVAKDFSGPEFSEPRRDPKTGLMCVYQGRDGVRRLNISCFQSKSKYTSNKIYQHKYARK